MIKQCKACKREINVAEGVLINLRCNICGSLECSIDTEVVIVCHYCEKEKHILDNEYENIKNTCSQSGNNAQNALWTIFKVKKSEKNLKDEIEAIRITLKSTTNKSKESKNNKRKTGRKKKIVTSKKQ